MDYLLNRELDFDKSAVHSCNENNAIVMLSGGLDSSIALWWALDNYKNIQAITVDYNQPHVIENDYAERLCKLVGIKYNKVKLDIPNDFWALTNRITRGQAGLMIAVAALNIGHEGADIVNGILKTDDLYGDCHREHLDSLADVLKHPNDDAGIGIATPLRAVKDKSAVMAWGYKLGVPMSETWSCRNPVDNKPCLTCSQCYERELAKKSFYNEYGVKLETIYQWQKVIGSPYHPRFTKCPSNVLVLIKAFIELGGMRNAVYGWRYLGPDGFERMATHIKNPDILKTADRSNGFLCKHVSIHGELDDGYRWEVCFCNDKEIAVTEKLPSFEIIEKAFYEKYLRSI